MTAPDGPDAGIKVLPPVVYLAAMVAALTADRFWHLPIVPGDDPPRAVLRGVGVVLCLAGIVLGVAAVAAFRRAGTSPSPHAPASVMVTAGPYRFMRNPMYLGLALLVAGIGIGTNDAWPLLALIPTLVVIRTQVIALEETYLAARFGDDYRAYRARVRRWF